MYREFQIWCNHTDKPCIFITENDAMMLWIEMRKKTGGFSKEFRSLPPKASQRIGKRRHIALTLRLRCKQGLDPNRKGAYHERSNQYGGEKTC